MDARTSASTLAAAGEDMPLNGILQEANRHKLVAALVGGAVTAGAYFGTRALARRNVRQGQPVSSVMAAAITACDVDPGSKR